jgi:hypothetical protein
MSTQAKQEAFIQGIENGTFQRRCSHYLQIN